MLAKYIDEYNNNGEIVENKKITLNEVCFFIALHIDPPISPRPTATIFILKSSFR